jgi:TonB family protein
MSSLFRSLALLAGAALPISAAAGAPPEPQRPIRQWNLDWGATACNAIATYGSADKPTTLAFRPSPNGTMVRLVVLLPGRGVPAYQFEVKTNITGATVRTNGLRFPGTSGKHDVIWINFTPDQLAGLRSAGEIALDGGPLHDRFALPTIGKVLDSLEACNADLRKYWNVGGVGASLSKPARSKEKLRDYFSSADYPSQALQQSDTGASTIMMMIDENGKLKDCMVEETSGVATLDAMTCAILQQRAKFEPALDLAGKPARSVLTDRVRWRIEP